MLRICDCASGLVMPKKRSSTKTTNSIGVWSSFSSTTSQRWRFINVSTPCPQFELEVVLVYVVENEPKFYGLFSGKRAADELAGKIAGARTQQVQVIERNQAEDIDVKALIG